jgi:predicted MFS family arabinose efflux permease
MAAVSLLVLALVPLSPEHRWLLLALLLPTTVGIALGDVIVDALMVEKGQPLGLTGRFQSIQWAAANAALLLTGVIGGYIAETKLQSLAIATCAALWMLAFVVTWRFTGEGQDEHLSAESFSETGAALLGIFEIHCFLPFASS